MAQSSYQKINLTADLVLTWPFSFLGGTTVADRNDVNPNQNGWTITLPDATLASPGENFLFNNVSSFSFDIFANDLITLLTTIDPGEIFEFYLYDSSTANGLWRIIPYGSGTNAIVALTAQSTNSSIVITNGSITPPGGNINFALPTSISNLNNVSTTSFVIATNTNPLTWKTVELIAGENIQITDYDGISGNPIINLNPVVTGLSSLQVGDMTLSGSIITSDITNGNIQIVTNGTGAAQINGVSIDVDGNITGVNSLAISGNISVPGLPKAYCTFTDTVIGESHTITIKEQINVADIIWNSNGNYTINFTNPLNSFDYGVFVNPITTEVPMPLISNGAASVRQEEFVTIIVSDASGEPVVSAQNGICVLVISSS